MEMQGFIKTLLNSGPSVRWKVAGIIAAALVVAVAAVLLERPARASMFAVALHPEQLTEVEQQLAQWNVPFTPTADNVLVDVTRRNALLLRLSLAGIPHTHVESSADLLGKVGALTPQSVIDAQSRDGLAGDIELALRGIQNVEDARVIIAPAKSALFADEPAKDATASVRLRLTPGTHLAADAIAGIRAFVAAGVPELNARSVTILDDRGVALTEGADVADDADLQRSLQSALDLTLGPGVSLVRVHVDYDTRSVTTRDVRRAPASAQGISVERQDERYTASGKRYSKSSSTLERGTDEREVTATMRPGQIARISAAVFVDVAAVTNLTQIRSLAIATLGIDARRGDTLQVEPVPFKHSDLPRHDVWWLAYGAIVPLMPAVVTAIVALVALRWAVPLLRPLVNRLTEGAWTARASHAVQGIAPAKVRGVLAHEPPHTAAAIISALPTATAAAVLDMYPEHERSAIVRRMQRPTSPLLSDAEELIVRA